MAGNWTCPDNSGTVNPFLKRTIRLVSAFAKIILAFGPVSWINTKNDSGREAATALRPKIHSKNYAQ